MASETELREEVEARLDRPFARVREELEELFDRDWDEVEVFIATSAHKKDRSEADVIVELVERVHETPPVSRRMRNRVIRWIGKPWRERENPWEKYKHRIPEPPSTDLEERSDDLDEWAWRPEDEG